MSPTAEWNDTPCVVGYLYKCRFIFLYRWFSRPQANKVKDLCFAPFLRNLLWTHKSKGKCHQVTPHHVREGIKESEFMTPISKRHKLNKKAQVPDMSCSLYTWEPGHWLLNHICVVFLVAAVLEPLRDQPIHTRACWGSMGAHFTPTFHQLPWGGEGRGSHGLLHCSCGGACSARGTEHQAVLILTKWTHWPPPWWDISVFPKAWQEAVWSESGKILVKRKGKKKKKKADEKYM